MNFSQGHSGTKVDNVNRACFPKEKHQNSHKNGRLFVLALSLVWFAGATPDRIKIDSKTTEKSEKRGVHKISARNSGAGNGCAKFMGAWHFLVLSAGKPPCP